MCVPISTARNTCTDKLRRDNRCFGPQIVGPEVVNPVLMIIAGDHNGIRDSLVLDKLHQFIALMDVSAPFVHGKRSFRTGLVRRPG